MTPSDRRAKVREILDFRDDINEALDQLDAVYRDWFMELLPKKKIQYVIFGEEAYIKYQNANLEINGFNAAIDKMSQQVMAAFKTTKDGDARTAQA